MKLIHTLFLFIAIGFNANAQEFSVLTCSSGEEIYSTFGHSAIRYTDSSQNIDEVYNYGLFDFGDPNFIPKFCNGLLDYKVGRERFEDFMVQYQYQDRQVIEQKLNLSITQKDSLLQFLEWNIRPENQYYRYNFLYNNCATKIIDIIQNNCSGVEVIHEYDNNTTFRKLIHQYAHNSVPFIDWGMDLGIGQYTDTLVTKRDYCFLPDYVSKTLETSLNLKTGSKLVSSVDELIMQQNPIAKKPFYKKPVFAAIIFLLFTIYARLKGRNFYKYYKYAIFIVAGIAGLVLAYLWFFTEHSVTKMNWNILWLNPFYLIYLIQLMIGNTRLSHKVISFSKLIWIIIAVFGIQKFHAASVICAITLMFMHATVIYKGNIKYKFRK